MDVIGIIAEYNPFHNGHIYHINKIKEMYPNSIIILVLNGYFLERGEISIQSIQTKTKLAIEYGVDLVIQLPFILGSNSADIFSDAVIEILNELKVEKLIFGSECNDIEKLKNLAKNELKNTSNIKEFLNMGLSYPSALSKATNSNINTPNDILGVCYIKSIIKNNYNIEPITIKRTNNYHDILSNSNIISASNIREKIKNNLDITPYLPNKELVNEIDYDLYFNLLKYKIINDEDLSKYLTVDEGIENRLKKAIKISNSLEELIKNIKTKRYTYNRINRMLVHILIGLTKEDKNNVSKNEYIRLLGFNNNGKDYINKIKKDTNIPIVSSLKSINSIIKDYEIKAYEIYNMLSKENILDFEEKNKPYFY